MKRLATFGVGSATYLLVVVGTHYHAVARAAGTAHNEHRNWSSHTVCGRPWHVVADPDHDDVIAEEPAAGPDCRACLRALTRRPSM
jgi:hypothetical protein